MEDELIQNSDAQLEDEAMDSNLWCTTCQSEEMFQRRWLLTYLVALFIFEQITNKLDKWGHLTQRERTLLNMQRLKLDKLLWEIMLHAGLFWSWFYTIILKVTMCYSEFPPWIKSSGNMVKMLYDWSCRAAHYCCRCCTSIPAEKELLHIMLRIWDHVTSTSVELHLQHQLGFKSRTKNQLF